MALITIETIIMTIKDAFERQRIHEFAIEYIPPCQFEKVKADFIFWLSR